MSSNTNGEHDLKVMVIGAGSAGLLVAHGFAKAGISCVVFEQDARIDARPRDWDFGIYWAQSPLEECLPSDIFKLVPTVQVTDHVPSADDNIPIFNGETGEPLARMATPHMLRLKRRSFIKLISTGVDIRYGKKLARIDTETTPSIVTAFFHDGTHYSANLLVSCEGAHSLTREVLLGPEKAQVQPSHVVATVCLAKFPAPCVESFLQLHHRSTIAIHPNGNFTWLVHDSRDKPNPEDWEFMFVTSWPQEEAVHLRGDEILQDLKHRGECFGEPYRSFFRAIPHDAQAWHSRLSSWKPVPWDNRGGLVTLAGDAAHPMTFHRGQGLNNAIADAVSLGQQVSALTSLTPETLAEAVRAYEAELIPRGSNAVEMNNLNTATVTNWSALMESPLMKYGSAPDPVINREGQTASA